jgi:hypothetical protein
MTQPLHKCKYMKEEMVPMHRWAEVLGHAETNKLLAERKTGKDPVVKVIHFCSACEDCLAYFALSRRLNNCTLRRHDG